MQNPKLEFFRIKLNHKSDGGCQRLLNVQEPMAIMLIHIHNDEGEVVQSVALSPSLGYYNLLR